MFILIAFLSHLGAIGVHTIMFRVIGENISLSAYKANKYLTLGM